MVFGYTVYWGVELASNMLVLLPQNNLIVKNVENMC